VLPPCRRLEAEDDVTVKSIDPTADGWFDVEDHPVVAAARTGFDMGVPFNEFEPRFRFGFQAPTVGRPGPYPFDHATGGRWRTSAERSLGSVAIHFAPAQRQLF